jgi:hypothetical protein
MERVRDNGGVSLQWGVDFMDNEYHEDEGVLNEKGIRGVVVAHTATGQYRQLTV